MIMQDNLEIEAWRLLTEIQFKSIGWKLREWIDSPNPKTQIIL